MGHSSGGHYSDDHGPTAIGGHATAEKDLLKRNKLGIYAIRLYYFVAVGNMIKLYAVNMI